MIVQKPSDLLAYLSDTGPISLEDLVIRSGSDAGEVIQDLAQLVQSGEVEVAGVDKRELQNNLEKLQHSLDEFDIAAVPSQEAALAVGEARDADDRAALATEMQRSLYEGLRHIHAGDAQLQLSFKGFRRLPSLQRR